MGQRGSRKWTRSVGIPGRGSHWALRTGRATSAAILPDLPPLRRVQNQSLRVGLLWRGVDGNHPAPVPYVLRLRERTGDLFQTTVRVRKELNWGAGGIELAAFVLKGQTTDCPACWRHPALPPSSLRGPFHRKVALEHAVSGVGQSGS